MRPGNLDRRRVLATWQRLQRDEEGIALVLALLIMLVLMLMLTAVMLMTAAGARDAHRSNSGQKASALAESGVNNALAVLNANYPATTFPGDGTLLPTRTTTYPTGTVTWGGSLVQSALGSQWPYEWQLTATGTVANPTGPGASPVSRTIKALVPVVMPATEDAGGDSVLNFIYASTDLTFLQSVDIATPVYATRDLILGSTATIKAAATTVAVGRNLTLINPQNTIGTSAARVSRVYVQGSCTYKNQPTHTPCAWDNDNVFATGPGVNQGGTTIPTGLINTPVLGPTQIGFWYSLASPGPKFPCVTSSGAVPVFDTNTTLDNSAGGGSAQDLTPNTPYDCTTPSGRIKWEPPPTNKLTIGGTVYIDGSAYISSGSATYDGVGTIVLSGTFYMDNNKKMCANAACDATSWDPNGEALVIVAYGDGAGCCGQSQVAAGDSIDIKKGTFQGALIANKSIDASVTGTSVIGPMIAVNGAVSAGQGSGASYPPISFAATGTGGITSPPPPGALLTPRNYGGG